MKKLLFCAFLFVCGCAATNYLKDMRFQPIPAGKYTIASWYKITKVGDPLKVYIEGDGHAFDKRGQPTDNPTPQNQMIRELAANDPSPNVVYLARPCQYMMSNTCSVTDWTTGRFSADIIDSMDRAVATLMKKARTDRVILIGYSGGAQVAGLIAVNHPAQVQKLITIAGVTDYEKWAAFHNDDPLKDSISLKKYHIDIKKINQIHYVGKKDKVVPPELAAKMLPGAPIIKIKGASHTSGFDKFYPEIWSIQ